jgi:hypothetical protein
MSRVKRHAPGLYTVGDWAVSRECECTGYCGGKWVIRPVLSWDETDYPHDLGYYGPMSNTKAELIEMLLAQD